MVSYTADMFMSLDGFGTGPVGYWGKEGPELVEQRKRVFFAGQDETLVLGANTYRLMERFAAEQPNSAEFTSLTQRGKVVISTTLEEPLRWDNTTLMAQDALEAVPRLKAESPLPLRSHGSISMNRALLSAGLVDRLEITVFPIITGKSGSDPILAGLPDIDLELVDARLLDGRIQQLVYVPTVLASPLG
jgi:dihydrofolate reductase